MEWEIAQEFDLELNLKMYQYPHHCLKKRKKHEVKTGKGLESILFLSLLIIIILY